MRSRRTRIALAPPPFDLIRSGRRCAIARRRGSSALREVSTVRCSHSSRALSARGHHGGTSCSSATSHSHPASASPKALSRSRPAPGTDRPCIRFHVSTRNRITAPASTYTPALAAALPHRSRAVPDRAHGADRAGRRAEAVAAELRRPRPPVSGAHLPGGRPRARGHPSRPASSSWAVIRWCCAPTSCSSAAASPCATPPTSSRAMSPPSASAPAPTRSPPNWPSMPRCRSSTC